MSDVRWVQCTPSEYAWERAALAYLEALFPKREPYRAWANAEFIGSDGSVNEIDLLLVTPARIIVLEIKSWSGVLQGDAGTWQHKRRVLDNPVIGANRKARKIKSLLGSQPAMRGLRVPWVEAAVFLSNASLDVQLAPEGRAHVFGRHGQDALPNVIEHITEQGPVDARLSRALARAVDQAGIRPSQRTRMVGTFRLEVPAFQEGPGWQDFLARHQRFPEDPPRRIRIYLATRADARDERNRLVRAAEREYRALRGIDHPGIAVPVDFVEHDLGPALVFRHDPSWTRLDHFLRQHGRDLTFDDRLALLRALAETIAYAHRRVLNHRGLSPQCVWVRQDGDAFAVQVTDWQTASRGPESSSGGVTSTSNYAELADLGATAYFAPEWGWGAGSGVALDIFSLGAIAYHLFSGGPPAPTYSALTERLATHGKLSLVQQVDAIPAAVDLMVGRSTEADAERRTPDVASFLLDLDSVRQQMAEAEEMPLVVADPLDAEAGTELEGGFTVAHRLGRGSTALALLVERDGAQAVLKVSLDPEKDDRLAGEAATLAVVGDHRGVVDLLSDGVIEVGPRKALLLSLAGERTLAQEIRERGRLQPEWLHDWGSDLLDIVHHLERSGVAHRDIKPDNLGVAERAGKGTKRQLVLFDFSLSREPLDAIRAGTPPYLDPFLGGGDRRRWDPAAERYAAAVTLYEMATARRPEYGAARGHPGFSGADVSIEPELFDRSYAPGLAEFFRHALDRDARKRFDTAEEMRRAWDAVFASPATLTPEQPAPRVTRDTPVGAAGLSPQVLAVLERLEITAVGAAIDLSPAQVVWLPGIGTKTRQRLRSELDRLARQVADATAERPSEPTLLDRVAAALVSDGADREAAETLLGLGEVDVGAWTSLRDAAKRLGREQRTLRDTVADLERHWVSMRGMADLREQLVDAVEAVGGLASAAHCASVLVDKLGSTVEGPLRTRLAEAVVRAAIDAELADEGLDGDPRLVYSREPQGILVAAGPPHPGERPSTAERLAWASRLGAAADELAADDPLPVPARVVEALRGVPAPPGTDPSLVFPERLVEVAVIASAGAAVTPRLEIYPRGLDAGRALRLAAGALYGVDALAPAQVAERVVARFPAAAVLPGRPELDGLLDAAGVPLRWDEDQRLYLARKVGAAGLTSLLTRRTTPRVSTGGTLTRAGWRRVENDVLAADDRLARSLEEGGWLVLSVPPRRVTRAERCLAGQAVTTVDVERTLLAGMREFCERHDVRWPLVLEADAADRTSPEWGRLSRVVDAGMAAVRDAVEVAGPAVLLANAGVLARYDPSLALVAELREAVRTATAASPVRTVWLLVPWADTQKQPLLDGAAVPVFGNQWLPLPQGWVEKHESQAEEGGAA